MHFRWAVYALAFGIVLSMPQSIRGQIRYDRGQNVAPAFEGWVRNADGTFTMYFGYMNRNWEEELHIPIGPENYFEPGEADRGQPTFFSTRRHKLVFGVRVPSDWGRQDSVWTLTAHGRTEKAYGWLVPEQEITERVVRTGGSLSGSPDPDNPDTNQPPSITLGPIETVTSPRMFTLIVSVTDDGLPEARSRRPARVPDPERAAADRGRARGRGRIYFPPGLSVAWMQHRGPSKVTFNPTSAPVTEGRAETAASVSAPGNYVLRAIASDGELMTIADIEVTVHPEQLASP